MGSVWQQVREKSLWISGQPCGTDTLTHRPAITVTTTRPYHTLVTGLILRELR